jgi:RNA polymerase primary sigma factor
LTKKRQPERPSSTRRVDEGSLNIYLREISRIPLLTRDEEYELAKRVRKGDPKAREKLVASNLRFVVKIAKAYQNRGISLVDLINEGNLGLIRAVGKFDERKGVRFISYAIWWIRQALLRSIAEQSKIVRLPMNKAGRVRKVARAARDIGQQMGREPTREEIAERLGLEAREVTDAVAIAKKDISLDIPPNDYETLTLSDMIESTLYPSPEEFVEREKFVEEMGKAVASLGRREAKILRLYFGLGEERPHTLEEIGTMLGLSRERVRQIKQKALSKLREAPEGDRLKSFL